MASTHTRKVGTSIFFRMAGAMIFLLFTVNFFSVASAADTVEMWQERDYPYERYGGSRQQQEDWYGKAYENYEESPYGYYDEDYFYGDFDLEYWDERPEKQDEDWYERRFRSYSDENGYGYRR